MDKTAVKEKFAKAFTKDNIAKAIFLAFALFSMVAVFAIIIYILYASIPAFQQIGFFKFLFGTEWLESTSSYGVGIMIVGTLALTACAMVIGGILGVVVAVWIVFYCPKKLKKVFVQLINLLAGIPSIVYGLFAYKLLMPTLLKISGAGGVGTGLLPAAIILGVMVLPTVASLSKNSLQNVSKDYYEGALALGCTKHQAVWTVMLPAAKRGITSAIILGIGRAVGETMAVQMIVGNGSGYPGWFTAFTTLTSNIVKNWGYGSANELHRSALIADAFVLLILILILNLILFFTQGKQGGGNNLFKHKIQEGQYDAEKVQYKYKGVISFVMYIVSWVFAALVAFILAFIVVWVLVKGIPNISANFLFGDYTSKSPTIKAALVATLMLIGLALVIAVPIGVCAAIYLNEYSKKGSKLVKVIRLFIDTLSGVPSIIFGVFGYIFFVNTFNMGYSLTGGGITLSLMILPTIIRSTEQALSEVPDSMREASYALGAGKVRTIFKVVLPQAIAGIITAVILSIGRIISESAALIFTAGSSGRNVPKGYGDQCASLAVMIYIFMVEGKYFNEAYATAAVVLILVIILNLLVTWVEHMFNNKKNNKKGFIRRAIDNYKLKKQQQNTTEKETENV
ncbi:MAG: phosphate ABC transporter permease PstA [Clostridia bacterium]|nr:phosphate ABC transporter permease PstA [Clostridia bacterium]